MWQVVERWVFFVENIPRVLILVTAARILKLGAYGTAFEIWL